MLHVIAIDPGVNTGVVLLEDEYMMGQPMISVVLSVTDDAPYDFLKALLIDMLNVDVVCEESPKRGHQVEATQRVEELVRQHARRLTWIRPSQWKGHPKASIEELDSDRLTTKHEQDAASLGAWFLRTQRSNLNAPV